MKKKVENLLSIAIALSLVTCSQPKSSDDVSNLLPILLLRGGTASSTTSTGTTSTGSGSGSSSGSTSTTTSSGSTTLSISSFSPSFGVAGTSVTISGSNFSATTSGNSVKFNGTTAVVNSATTSSLTVTAPNGVTSGTISVTVNGVTATSTASFSVSPWTSISFTASDDVYRISCPNSNTCFALTQASSSANTKFLRTLDGGSNWTIYDTGYSIFGSLAVLAGGMSCPDINTCYLVGSKASSKILKITSASGLPSIAQVGNNGFYYAISCPTSTFCIATGTNSTQRTTDGTNWSSISASYTMVTVHCVDTNTCYGGQVNAKTIYKTSDASAGTPSWATQSISTGTSVYSLQCVDSNTCMAVGLSVLAKTTDGTNWNSLTIPFVSGTSTTLNGVYCFDANTCTIVGSNTTVWRTSDGGSNWANQSFGATNTNNAVSCTTSSSNTCYVATTSGYVFKRTSN